MKRMEEAIGADAGRRAARRPLQILVVDDDLETREALAALLISLGHGVTTAASGRDALRVVLDLPLDLILLDIDLPDMDGYEVGLRLARLGERGMAVVALTGYGSADHVRRSIGVGFDDHLVKPPDPTRLRSLLAGVAARRTRRRPWRDAA